MTPEELKLDITDGIEIHELILQISLMIQYGYTKITPLTYETGDMSCEDGSSEFTWNCVEIIPDK